MGEAIGLFRDDTGGSPALHGGVEEAVAARLERLPLSGWHFRTVGVVGIATLFDAFDALTIAFVLPVLVGQWGLVPGQVGLLISAGYVGQLIGAVGLSLAAERFGRLRVLRWAVGILSLLSIACAFVGSYPVLLTLRFVQGIGLGGEVPLAATFINELSAAHYRGRLVFLLETAFAVGVMLTSVVALWVIPSLGWPAMFLIGGTPIILALLLGLAVPESPRWLAGHRHDAAAKAAMMRIERAVSANGKRPLPPPQPLPAVPAMPPATLASLLSNGYARRTVTAWTIMFCTSLAGYGLLAWLPTIYRTVYGLPLTEVLRVSFIGGVVGLLAIVIATLLVDIVGRRLVFAVGFTGCALPLLALWALPADLPVTGVVTLATISYCFISVLLAGVYAYVPEIYPTRMRALGAGVASAWLRLASIIGPAVVGLLLSYGTTQLVFLFFGLAAAAGALVSLLCLIETRGRPLEAIAR